MVKKRTTKEKKKKNKRNKSLWFNVFFVVIIFSLAFLLYFFGEINDTVNDKHETNKARPSNTEKRNNWTKEKMRDQKEAAPYKKRDKAHLDALIKKNREK